MQTRKPANPAKGNLAPAAGLHGRAAEEAHRHRPQLGGTGIEKKPRKLPIKTVETQIRALCDGTVENYLHLLAVHETRGAGITELDKARKLLRQQWQDDYENNRPLSFGPGKLIPMCARCA